jgi:hypothetical protein
VEDCLDDTGLQQGNPAHHGKAPDLQIDGLQGILEVLHQIQSAAQTLKMTVMRHNVRAVRFPLMTSQR